LVDVHKYCSFVLPGTEVPLQLLVEFVETVPRAYLEDEKSLLVVVLAKEMGAKPALDIDYFIKVELIEGYSFVEMRVAVVSFRLFLNLLLQLSYCICSSHFKCLSLSN
jgi:hypothetical protein